MGLRVEPEQVAALRVQLRDSAETRRLVEQIQADPEKHRAFPVFFFYAFQGALLLRFPDRFSVGDIVGLVADARLYTRDASIDPYAAEVLARRALGDQRVSDVSVGEQDGAVAQFQLLSYLLATSELDDPGVDALIERAKTLTEQRTEVP